MRHYRNHLLERGSSGDAVPALQEGLNAVGYDLDCDGIFGHDTEHAVRNFQSNNDLDVDGIVGPDTWNALIDALG